MDFAGIAGRDHDATAFKYRVAIKPSRFFFVRRDGQGIAKTIDNVVCAEGGASLAKMPGGEAWKKRYDAKYPGQFQVYSPYTYDATFVLVDAMKRAGSADPKVYTPELAKANYKGVTTTISFEPNGELKNPAITLYVYKDGKKVALN